MFYEVMNMPFLNNKKMTTLDEVFDNLFPNTQSLKADILETDKEYIIVAEIPGLDKKDINITYDKDTLKITGKKKKEKNTKYLRQELFTESYERTFSINEDTIDVENIKSSYKNGLVTITLPKKEEVKQKAKTILIN